MRCRHRFKKLQIETCEDQGLMGEEEEILRVKQENAKKDLSRGSKRNK